MSGFPQYRRAERPMEYIAVMWGVDPEVVKGWLLDGTFGRDSDGRVTDTELLLFLRNPAKRALLAAARNA